MDFLSNKVMMLSLLVLADVGVRLANGWEFPLIQYLGFHCDSYITTNRELHVYIDMPTEATSEETCRKKCTSRTDCGGFLWKDSDNKCMLYNTNDAFIVDTFTFHYIDDIHNVRFNGSILYKESPSSRWNSKNCSYHLGTTDPTCNKYQAGDLERGFDTRWIQAVVGEPLLLTITRSDSPTQCYTLCTTYTGCKSVSVRVDDTNGTSVLSCHLYTRTIQEIEGTADAYRIRDEEDVEEPFTYYLTVNRQCGENFPYQPYQPDLAYKPPVTCPATG